MRVVSFVGPDGPRLGVVDVVEVEIEAIGTLVNPVEDERVPALPVPHAAHAGRSGR